MEKITLRKRTSTPGLFTGAFVILAFLWAWTSAGRADFDGSDSLATGSNWTLLSHTGSDARILFQNSRAELVVSGTLAGNAVEYVWNANTGGYANDWSVQADVHLGRIPLKSYADRGTLSLRITSGTSSGSNAFYARIGRYESLTNSYLSALSSAVDGNSDLGVTSNMTDTTLKVSFDSARKILTSYYRNGGGWKKLQSANIANDSSGWGMGSGDVFYAVLAGATSGTNVVTSGEAYFANFLATTGSVPNVSYTKDFSGIVPLWDLSGYYSSGEIDTGIKLDNLYLSGDVTGRLSTLNALYSIYSFYYGTPKLKMDDGAGTVLTGDATVNGTVSNSGTLTRVALTISASGTGTIAVSATTHAVNFTEAIKCNGEIQTDGSSRKLVITGGTATTKLKDKVTGKNVNKPVRQLGTGGTFDLPTNVTGDWNLTLNLTHAGAKYIGTAIVQIEPGGSAFHFTAAGNYPTGTDKSDIMLKDTGIKLNTVISISGSTMTVHSLTGKMYGQSLSY